MILHAVNPVILSGSASPDSTCAACSQLTIHRSPGRSRSRNRERQFLHRSLASSRAAAMRHKLPATISNKRRKESGHERYHSSSYVIADYRQYYCSNHQDDQPSRGQRCHPADSSEVRGELSRARRALHTHR